MSAQRFAGQSVPRVEDARILAGRTRFVADVDAPRQLHAVFVRSVYPHARVLSIDAEGARSLAGVEAVLTLKEIGDVVRPMQIGTPVAGLERPAFAPLAHDRVRHVGDPLAIVVAECRYAAEDAAASISVDYEPDVPVVTAEQALDPAAPLLFDEIGTNVLYRRTTNIGDVEKAFAEADLVVGATLRHQRCAQVPLETRGGLADYDRASRSLTYTASTQNPHGLRFGLAASLVLPLQDIRVVSGDVGGGFGQKMVLYREDVALCAASMVLGRPVKWIEDRVENLSASGQAREDCLDLEAAVRAEGTILGLRGSVVLDHGAYPAVPIPPSAYTAHMRVLLPDCYSIPAFAFEETIVATNKASYAPYRGPWASAVWGREVLIDRIARAVGLDPGEIRLRNLLPLGEQPARMITGPTLEGVTARETLERLLELVDVDAFRCQQRAARAQRRLLGLGLATFVEPAPGPPDFGEATGASAGPERAHARLEPDGRLTLFTAQHPHGQGHETTLAQLVADELGLPLEHVRVVHGDTRDTPFSLLGTSGSRAATRASGAAIGAAREVKRQILDVAAQVLEIAADDLELAGGAVYARGAPGRQISLGEVALAAHLGSAALPAERAPGALEGGGTAENRPGGWSSASHCCVLEVDPETGLVRILRYLVVHDCGAIINPAIVEGQIRGGVAQGIGASLLEASAYDEHGQPLATTFMDYLLPTAADVPSIEIEHLESPPLSELDFRGVGEGGAIGAPAAVANAVADALGTELSGLPLTPTVVLEALATA